MLVVGSVVPQAAVRITANASVEGKRILPPSIAIQM
jgi:hypothetical protein